MRVRLFPQFALLTSVLILTCGCGDGSSSETEGPPKPLAQVTDDSATQQVAAIQPTGILTAPAEPGPADPAMAPDVPLDDPAVEAGSRDVSGVGSLGSRLPGELPSVAETTEESVAQVMQVDVVGRRVFLPAVGWVGEERFWDIYYNDSQLLPGDLDREGLVKLGYHEGQ
ncbi:MAG: hypothetical protein P1P84_04665 [Deferrisomatales bacterium]|nr:hypothetical protein [Deferrisomatales bacterium]